MPIPDTPTGGSVLRYFLITQTLRGLGCQPLCPAALFEVNVLSLAAISMCAEAMTPGSAGQQRSRSADATDQKLRALGPRTRCRRIGTHRSSYPAHPDKVRRYLLDPRLELGVIPARGRRCPVPVLGARRAASATSRGACGTPCGGDSRRCSG